MLWGADNVVITDGSKFGAIHPGASGAPGQIGVLVTDDACPPHAGRPGSARHHPSLRRSLGNTLPPVAGLLPRLAA